MSGDDLTQQLADVMEPWALADRTMMLDAARAVLASGLVVPTGDLLGLAQKWEDSGRANLGEQPLTSAQRLDCAAELRALVNQNNLENI